MSIKILILIMFGVLILVVVVVKWMKKLPQSVLNFIALLSVIASLIFGLWYLKKKLTEKHSWN